jgi:hypothetical protein
MCNNFRCLPSDLRREDPNDIKVLNIVLSKLKEKNPLMNMFS